MGSLLPAPATVMLYTEKWVEPSRGGRAPLSVDKGVVSWCLLTSQGTTTSNRKIHLQPPFYLKKAALKRFYTIYCRIKTLYNQI